MLYFSGKGGGAKEGGNDVCTWVLLTSKLSPSSYSHLMHLSEKKSMASFGSKIRCYFNLPVTAADDASWTSRTLGFLSVCITLNDMI